MIIIHEMRFLRMGAQRELKRSLDAYWAGQAHQVELLENGQVFACPSLGPAEQGTLI